MSAAASTLTMELELRTGENSIKYTVAVDDFGEKIASFSAGERIRSKDFQVGGSVFRLIIMPAGNEINSSDVAVYLANMSDRKVIAHVEFQERASKTKLKWFLTTDVSKEASSEMEFSNLMCSLMKSHLYNL